MVEEEDLELTFSHKYVKKKTKKKKKPICRMSLMEHILNTGRELRLTKGQEKSPCNWVGQKGEKEKREKESG